MGLETHVLRHWEDVGLLGPERDPAGRRRYSRDDLVRIAVIQRSKAAGMTLEQVQLSTRQTAEGVKSCRPILELARAHGVDVPITEAVVRLCHDGESPARMVREMMNREAKPE